MTPRMESEGSVNASLLHMSPAFITFLKCTRGRSCCEWRRRLRSLSTHFHRLCARTRTHAAIQFILCIVSCERAAGHTAPLQRSLHTHLHVCNGCCL